MKAKQNMLRVEEVALLVGCSPKTINIWYKFKKDNPDNEYSKKLPDFIREGNKGQRFWKESDIYKLIEFRDMLPRGRNGVMGEVTRPYWKYTTEKRRKNAEERRKSKML